MELLEKKYKSFEQRMEARIERDLNNSDISAEVIKSHLQTELNRKAQITNNAINNLSIGSKRNHFELISNNKLLYNNNAQMNEFVDNAIQSNFNFNRINKINNASPFNKVKEPSLELLNDRSFNYPAKKQKIEIIKEIIEDPNLPLNSCTFYGQIPIYVDVQDRAKIITKAGKLVEIHVIISSFLLVHDEKYRFLNRVFEANLKDDINKKPFSMLQFDRNIREKAEKISLASLSDKANNLNEANKKNLNVNVVENKKALPKEEQNNKADFARNNEKIFQEKTKESNQMNLESKIKGITHENKNNFNENIAACKTGSNNFNEKDKLENKKKETYQEKTKIDLIINNLIKIPNKKEKISEEKKCLESEKHEAPNVLSNYLSFLFIYKNFRKQKQSKSKIRSKSRFTF